MASPHAIDAPSDWIVRWSHLIAPGAYVLDLACGHGRHARWFAKRGCTVLAVDRDESALTDLAGIANVETRCVDLESGAWPLEPSSFDAVIVTHYLHRPLFAPLAESLRPGGVLIYETFMRGNERFGKPSNPDFLLLPNELLDRFSRLALTTIAFEQGTIESPKPAALQRLCAARADSPDYVLGRLSK